MTTWCATGRHDTDVVGRTPQNACRECKRLAAQRHYQAKQSQRAAKLTFDHMPAAARRAVLTNRVFALSEAIEREPVRWIADELKAERAEVVAELAAVARDTRGHP